MNRWAVRLLGLVILLVFILLMFNLQKQLLMIQRTRQPAATTTR